MSWEREPWVRQKGETSKSFEAFALYRDLGPARSLAQVAETLGKSRALIERWSRRWNWVARSGEWDDEVDKQTRIQRLEDIAEMDTRQARICKAVQSKVVEALSSMEEGTTVPIREWARLLEVSMKGERLARGKPDMTVGIAETDAETDALLDKLRAMLPEEETDPDGVDDADPSGGGE